MDPRDKIVLAHRGCYNNECRTKYQENSREVCAVSTTKDYIKIIELDLRKSKEGILYCHHGPIIQYFTILKFPQKLSNLKEKYNVNSLEEILNVITEDKIIFLDIKDSSVTREDILAAFSGRNFKEVILGNKSVSYLKRFDNMPEKFVKKLSGNPFCNFYNIEKLKKNNFKYFEVVFPFQINQKIVNEVHANNMEFKLWGPLSSNKEGIWNKINKHNIRHISSRFI